VTLSASAEPLSSRYDVALLDLDGVVYLSGQAIPGAPEALEAARRAGMRLGYVTNNASRRPRTVAELLTRLGVPATPDDVVTSAQAACHLLAEQLPAGARVLVIGADALAEEVALVGLTPVRSADGDPAAVVQGYGPEVGWKDLAEAAVAIRRGARWVATNTDRTVPSPRGPLPGNGALVQAVRLAVATDPVVVGKPRPRLMRESVERTRAECPLVVGDRLDTDIEGAHAAGLHSLLVLTGVHGPRDLLAARPDHRPDYLAADLHGLLTPHPEVRDGRVGGWTARRSDTKLELAGAGDPIDALRALCAVAWSADPATDRGTRDAQPPEHVEAVGEAAAEALGKLGLA
jgi:glycerol-1-phosphatase